MAVKVRRRRGKWWVSIHHDGKRKMKCVGTREAAERVAQELSARLTLGEFGLTDRDDHVETKRPFGPSYMGWIDTYVEAHCKRTTRDGYHTSGRLYWVPAFGDSDLKDITREQVKAVVYSMLGKGLSRATVKAHLAPLREMFNHAIDDGYVASNPVVRILQRSRRDARERRAPEAEFLTREEVGLLLDSCQGLLRCRYPFVLLLCRTGLRLGEALGLEWGDLDFNGRCAEIRRAVVRGRVETPKSGKARRVDLSHHLVETLQALHLRQRREAMERGVEPPSRVFPGVDPNNFRRRDWRRLLDRAGLRHVPIKALRHTFASLLIAQGESLAYVRDQLGHHSIQMTVDHYGHLVPGGNREAVDRLDAPASPVTERNPDATTAAWLAAKHKATQGIRTLDLPITNRLLYQLS